MMRPKQVITTLLVVIVVTAKASPPRRTDLPQMRSTAVKLAHATMRALSDPAADPPMAVQCGAVQEIFAGSAIDVPTDCCAADVVSCDHERRRVLGIGGVGMPSASLRPLPTTLCEKVPHLLGIVLIGQNLTGTLPEWLAQCHQLELISFANNALTGTLPLAWAQLKYLEHVDLERNRLLSSIPKEWGDLEVLQTLKLSYNGISGQLPAELGRSRKLWHLDVSSNNLTGTLPPEWAGAQISEVILHTNRITGTLPSEWGSLSDPINIELYFNELSGTLPESWTFSDMSIIQLAFNSISGTLPSTFSAGVVDLRYNRLTGVSSGGLNEAIWALFLSANYIAGAPPCPSKNLWLLRLEANKLTGTIPSCYNTGEMSDYGLELYLDFNEVEALPPSLRQSDIRVLSLGSTHVTELPLFSELPEWLQDLNIPNARLRTLPADFTDAHLHLPYLCVLNLRNNLLTHDMDAAPVDGLVKSLSVFDLSSNSILGQRMIPLPGFEPDNFHRRDCWQDWGTMIDVTSRESEFPGLGYKEETDLSYVSRWEARLPPYQKILEKAESVSYGIIEDVPCAVVCSPTTLAVTPQSYDLESRAISAFGFEFLTSNQEFSSMNTRNCFCNRKVTLLDYFDATMTIDLMPSMYLPWEGNVELIRRSPSGFFHVAALPAELPFDQEFQLRLTVTMHGPSHTFYSDVTQQEVTLRPPQLTEISPPVVRTRCSSEIQLAIRNTTTCLGCPQHAMCDGSTRLTANGEYWRPSREYITLLRCEMQGCRSSAPREGWECASGYSGALCGACKSNHRPLHDRCIPCLENTVAGSSVLACFFLLLLLYVLGTILLEIRVVETEASEEETRDESSEESPAEKAKQLLEQKLMDSNIGAHAAALRQHSAFVKKEVLIMVKMITNHMSLIGFVLQSRTASTMMATATWATATATAPAQVTKMDQLRVYLQCALEIGPLEMLFAVLPLFLALFFATFTVITIMSCFPEKTGVPPPRKKWRSVIAIIFLLFADTLFAVGTAPMSCDTLKFQKVDGSMMHIHTMRTDRAIECSGAEYLWALVVGIFQVFLATIGLPVLCALMFRSVERKKGREHAVASFAFMCGNFRPERWWWELLLLARRNVCVLVLITIQDSVMQLLGLNFVLVLFLASHQRVKPYSNGAYNRNDTISIISSITTLSLAGIFQRVTTLSNTFGAVVIFLIALLSLIPFPFIMVRRIKEHMAASAENQNSILDAEMVCKEPTREGEMQLLPTNPTAHSSPTLPEEQLRNLDESFL